MADIDIPAKNMIVRVREDTVSKGPYNWQQQLAGDYNLEPMSSTKGYDVNVKLNDTVGSLPVP